MLGKTVLAACAAIALLAVGACGLQDAKFIGTGKCLDDHSVVWFALPNSQGSYEGIRANNDMC